MQISEIKVGDKLVDGTVEMVVSEVHETKVCAIQTYRGKEHKMTITASAMQNPHLRKLALVQS